MTCSEASFGRVANNEEPCFENVTNRKKAYSSVEVEKLGFAELILSLSNPVSGSLATLKPLV
jgi:hypothetical protein